MNTSMKNTCVQPRSLCMTTQDCHYCISTDTKDEMLKWMYGIRRCEAHAMNALRDCNAELHRRDMVRFKDLKGLVPYMDLPIKVVRSSGVEESDWVLNSGIIHYPSFIQKIDGIWSINVKKMDDSLSRYIQITELDKSGIDSASILALLNNGVYINDFKNYVLTVNDDMPTIAPDHHMIKTGYFNGKEIRYV